MLAICFFDITLLLALAKPIESLIRLRVRNLSNISIALVIVHPMGMHFAALPHYKLLSILFGVVDSHIPISNDVGLSVASLGTPL